MLRKTIGVLILVSLLSPLGLATAQFPPPPPGFYTAMADLGVRLGKPISLTCSNLNNAASCVTSDPLFNWSWGENTYENNALGCPNLPITLAGSRKGYVFELIYNNIVYDYRQDQSTGKLSLCSIGGNRVPVEVVANTGQPTTDGQGTQPIGVCTLPRRLTVGSQARVVDNGIPNNIRAEPGQSGTFLGEIPSGAIFTVVGRADCSSGIDWWQVNYNGVVGWTAEGQDGEYWLEPLNTGPNGQFLVALKASNVNSLQLLSTTPVNTVSPSNGFYSSISRSFITLTPNVEIVVYRLFDTTGTMTVKIPTSSQVLGLSENGIYAAVAEPDLSLYGGIVRSFPLSPDNTPSDTGANVATYQPGVVQAIAINNVSGMVAIRMHDFPANSDHLEVLLISGPSTAPITLPLGASTTAIVFSADNTSLRVLGSEGVVNFYNTTTWLVERSFQVYGYVAGQNSETVSRMVFSQNDQYMAIVSKNTATGNSVVQLWDLTINTAIATVEIPLVQKGIVTDVAFSPDGNVIAVSSAIPDSLQGAVDLYTVPSVTYLRTVSTQNTNRMIIDSIGLLHIFTMPSLGNFAWEVWAVPQ